MARTAPEHAEVDRAAAPVLASLSQRLSGNLRHLRLARDWKQEEAAWRAALAVRVYQRLETGRGVNPTFRTLARLAVAFGVEVAELIAAPSASAPRAPKARPTAPTPRRTRHTTPRKRRPK